MRCMHIETLRRTRSVQYTHVETPAPLRQSARSAKVLQEALLEASSAMRDLQQQLQRQRRLAAARSQDASRGAPAPPSHELLRRASPQRQGAAGQRSE